MRRTSRMDQPAIRTCPKCGSGDYQFRSRRKVPGENSQGEQTETKYRCKGCGEEWRVRVAVKMG
jgi:DNA-directed RNA polymerase subunit M/transcription elongation factor TFIIS